MKQTTIQLTRANRAATLAQPFHTQVQLLESLDPIKKTSEARKLDLHQIQELESLKTAFHYYLAVASKGDPWGKAHFFADVFVGTFISKKNIRHTKECVELLSLSLAEFQEHEHFGLLAGPFLSALIKKGTDNDYAVFTSDILVPISELSYWSTKNITVVGNVYDVGNEMKGGTLIINGNVLGTLGKNMDGGTIIVNGDVLGKIELYGHDGYSENRAKRTIHINGSYAELGKRTFDSECNNLYHNGRLIVKDGKLIK